MDCNCLSSGNVFMLSSHLLFWSLVRIKFCVCPNADEKVKHRKKINLEIFVIMQGWLVWHITAWYLCRQGIQRRVSR